MKPRVIVADTSPLIALAVMDLFSILPKLFDTIYIPPAVAKECLADLTKPKSAIIHQALTEKQFIEKTVSDQAYCDLLAQVLDRGESEAIALAKQLDIVVLMDERTGRAVAKREGVECIGSLYCLIRAKQNGHIQAVKPRLTQLQEHGYYLAGSLIAVVLESCQE